MTEWVPGIYLPNSLYSERDGWQYNYLTKYPTEELAMQAASDWAHKPNGKTIKDLVPYRAKQLTGDE